MLNSVLWTPLVFGLIAMLVPKRFAPWAAGTGAVITLALAIAVLAGFDPDAVAELSGVPAGTIRRLGRAMLAAERPAALPPGVALTSRRATASAGAVLLLDAVVGAVGRSVSVPPEEQGGEAAAQRAEGERRRAPAEQEELG